MCLHVLSHCVSLSINYNVYNIYCRISYIVEYCTIYCRISSDTIIISVYIGMYYILFFT